MPTPLTYTWTSASGHRTGIHNITREYATQRLAVLDQLRHQMTIYPGAREDARDEADAIRAALTIVPAHVPCIVRRISTGQYITDLDRHAQFGELTLGDKAQAITFVPSVERHDLHRKFFAQYPECWAIEAYVPPVPSSPPPLFWTPADSDLGNIPRDVPLLLKIQLQHPDPRCVWHKHEVVIVGTLRETGLHAAGFVDHDGAAIETIKGQAWCVLAWSLIPQ